MGEGGCGAAGSGATIFDTETVNPHPAHFVGHLLPMGEGNVPLLD